MEASSGLPLPDELLFHTLTFLDVDDLSPLRQVCSQILRCANDEGLWKALCVKRMARGRGSEWLEKLKPPDLTWRSFCRQLTKLKVLVLYAERETEHSGIDALKRDLNEHGLRNVVMLNTNRELPSASTLREYAAVMVSSDDCFTQDNAELGNRMARYVDDGHGVVLGGFTVCGCSLTGAWAQGDYDPIGPTQSERANEPEMDLLLPDHPLMANVRRLRGTWETPYSPGSATANTTTIAEWEFPKEAGEKMLRVKRPPLVVEKHGFNGKIVALNFTPTSTALPQASTWPHIGYDAETDGAQLMVNALIYTALATTKKSQPPQK